MARPVYSTRFLGLSGAGIPDTTYTVPAGAVAVVRDVAAYIEADASTYLYVELGEGSIPIMVLASQASTQVLGHWTGNQVVPAGEGITAVSTSSVVARVAVSGYLLTA